MLKEQSNFLINKGAVILSKKLLNKRAFVVCVDSDGCAMDTMNVKHLEYFGPLLVKVFEIEDSVKFLELWNRINLFSITRGINRFKGLVLSLQTFGYPGTIDNLVQWVETTNELSNVSLQKQIDKTPTEDLRKAMEWSLLVNAGIKELEGLDAPFENVLKSLGVIHKYADIAIVSSANTEAVLSEWQRHGLIEYVDVLFGQEDGTKAASIQSLIDNGYDKNKILMVGDAPGDSDAAKSCGVHYFPILFGEEASSWNKLTLEALGKLISGTYTVDYQASVDKTFTDILEKYSE